MKNLSVLVVLGSLSTACGVVRAGAPDPATGDDTSGDDAPMGVDAGSSTPTPDAPAAPAIVLEAPRAATTANALSAMGMADRQGTVDFIQGTETRDVVEQPFTTMTDEPVTLSLVFASTPVVRASRAIAADTGTLFSKTTINVYCGTPSLPVVDPACNKLAPLPDRATASVVSSTARWSLGIYDEATHAMLSNCTSSCTLPAGKGHAYRVITSITNVTELWDGRAILATTFDGLPFIGRVELAGYCTNTTANGADWWCTQTTTYQRGRGLDTASMSFGDLDISITANGVASMTPATGLAWSYGDENLPGNAY